MNLPSENTMLKAIAERDSSFDDRFYYAVITTGVFCKPSCSSRTAKPENIRFYLTPEIAMQAGYRPCKRCKPLQVEDQMAIQLARYIEKHVEDKLTLDTLSIVAGTTPSKLQRLFKQSLGLSPKEYQDALRLHRFKHRLKNSKSVTEAIFSAGFGSISRIYGQTSRNIGMSPKAYKSGGVGESISYSSCRTKIGLMMLAATDKGVCFIQFGDSKKLLLKGLINEFPQAKLTQSKANKSAPLNDWQFAIEQHLSNNAPRPDLPLDIRGTVFQTKVWQFLISIKAGKTLSYTELATELGNPKAARAVASACAKNRIAVLIPCHRILRGDGSLGGYRWGLERKQALLDQELAQELPQKLEQAQ